MLEKLVIAVVVILVGAYFVVLFMDIKDYNERQEKEKQEAIELRIKNARLEERVKELDDRQAEQTKKIAENNKIGG